MNADTNPIPTLRTHLRLLWRYRWLLIVPTVLAAATAYALALQQPPSYASHADLLFDRSSMSASPSLDIRTEARVADSPGVAARAADALTDGATVTEVAAAVTAEPVEDLPLLRITAHAATGQRAEALVAATLDAYRTARRERTDKDHAAVVADASRRVGALREDLEEITQELGRADRDSVVSARRDALQTRRDVLISQLAVQQGRLDELRSDSPASVDDVSVLVPPTAADAPVSPRPLRSGTIGLLVGLLVGYALVLGRGQFDDRPRSLEGIEQALVAPTLSVVPPLRGRRRRDRVALTEDAASPEAEAYRILCANLAAAGVGRDHRILLVTSAVPEEGKSTTAVNLALAFAEAHTSVLLVDADLRRPRLHQLLDVPRGPGLTDALGAPPDFSGLTVLDTPCGRLGLLPAGTQSESPGEILSRTQLGGVLRKLAETRLVIVDAPPMLPVADAALLAAHADAVVVTVDPARSDHRILEQLRARIASTGTPLLGATVYGTGGDLVTGGYGYGYEYLRDAREPGERSARTGRRRRHHATSSE